MTIVIPTSCLLTDKYQVNTTVNEKTFLPVDEVLPGPKYTLQYHYNIIDKLLHGVINPGDNTDDFINIIKIRNIDFVIAFIENYEALSSLFNRQQPILIVYFTVSSGNKQGFLKTKTTDPWIKRIDSGLSILLAIERTDGLSIDNNYINEIIRLLDDPDYVTKSKADITIIKNLIEYMGTCEINDLHEQIQSIDNRDNHKNYQLYINMKEMIDLTSNDTNIIINNIKMIKKLIKQLVDILSNNGVTWTQDEMDFNNIDDLKNYLDSLKNDVNNLNNYSLLLIENCIKIQYNIFNFILTEIKNYQSINILTEYCLILETLYHKLSNFKEFQGYLLFLIRYRRIPMENTGNKYLIVFTELQQEIYQICEKNNFILCYSEDWYVNDEPCIFHFSGEDDFYGGGWILINKNAHNYGKNSSNKLFDKPSQHNSYKRLYICYTCKEFVYYHQNNPNWISCNCGGFDLSDVKWSLIHNQTNDWQEFIEEQMRIIETKEVINKHYIIFFDYLEELLEIWMNYNDENSDSPYIRESIYGRLAESLPKEFPKREKFLNYAYQCGFESTSYNKWSPSEILSQFRRLLLEEHFPIDIRYHFNHFIVQNWQF